MTLLTTTYGELFELMAAQNKRMDPDLRFSPRHLAYWKAWKRHMMRVARDHALSSPASGASICLTCRMADILDLHYCR